MAVPLYAISGVPPPGPGVMVMQLSVPNGPQPSQNPPLVQWNPCKYYSIEQRPSKPGDLYKPDNTPQVQQVYIKVVLPDSLCFWSIVHVFFSLLAHQNIIMECVFHSIFAAFFFVIFCPGSCSTHESFGLPHPVSDPFTLGQRKQCMSWPRTITPHFPVSPGWRTDTRYKWRWVKCQTTSLR